MEIIKQLIPENLMELLTTAESAKSNSTDVYPITDFTPEMLDQETFRKGITLLETDKNFTFTADKVKMLWHELKTWKKQTYIAAVKRIIATNTYNNVSMSDFTNSLRELPRFYNRSWYEKAVAESPNAAERIDIYVDAANNGFYKFTDGKNIRYNELKPIFVNGKYVKANNG